MRICIIRNDISLNKGNGPEHAPIGSIHDVDEATGGYLVGCGGAELVKDEDAP